MKDVGDRLQECEGHVERVIDILREMEGAGLGRPLYNGLLGGANSLSYKIRLAIQAVKQRGEE